MSNPPAGWYPDPTGQPETIRWWNGTQWTSRTEVETGADKAVGQPDDPDPGDPATPVDRTGTVDVEPDAVGSPGVHAERGGPLSAGTSTGQTDGSPQTGRQTADASWQQPSQGPDWSQEPPQRQGSPEPVDQWHRDNPWPQGDQHQNPWQTPAAEQQPPLTPSFHVPGPFHAPEPARARRPRSRVPVVVAGIAALVLIGAVAVYLVPDRREPLAGPLPPATPAPSPGAGQSPAPTPSGSKSTVAPGQSRKPELHEGKRITSDAISFPRQTPPWSDRKRFAPQVVNSSGQYVLLQENIDGKEDWYADVFVGGLSTAVLFTGDPRATAADLSLQLRSSLYAGLPITAKPLRNGAVKRSGKSGWYYQQSITANSPKVTARTLTLTVAVFDLGDGTAVAYVSDIPTNRADLKAAEAQVYKGIHVG
jgi:hypothetical protein